MKLRSHPAQLAITLLWVALLAYFFAQVEIQIEGSAGWAANLPTWRIENHWLLDIFWGGRAMTGYHAWVFPCVAMFFHFPLLFAAHWSWRAEARVIACIMLFWVLEDYLWFVCNPGFGWQRFTPADVAWHKHWILFAPADYWFSLGIALALIWFSAREPALANRNESVSR